MPGSPLPCSLADMLPCFPFPFCAWLTLLWILLKKENIDKFFPKHLPSLVPDTARCSIPSLAIESCVCPFAFLCFFIITVGDSTCLFCFTYLQRLSKKKSMGTSPFSCRSHTGLSGDNAISNTHIPPFRVLPTSSLRISLHSQPLLLMEGII